MVRRMTRLSPFQFQLSCPSPIIITAHVYTIIIMKRMSCVLIHDEALIINYPVAT